MRKIFILLLLTIFAVSCTKEVPETEKKSSKATYEKDIRKIIETYADNFNAGKTEDSFILFSEDFKAVVPDSDNALDLTTYKDNLKRFKKQYPTGKLQITIEEVFLSEELGTVQLFTSYLAPDVLDGKLSPVYSERSILIFRKIKYDGWKIIRSLGTPAFSYD
jgi:ketosteroid isomerase-like protein